MDFKNRAKFIIYRFRERGLEVFLVNNEQDTWELPEGELDSNNTDHIISLERVQEEDAIAVEADWHEIPSLKEMLLEDAQSLKDTIGKGSFVLLKEAIQKVLPHQYAFLKELKDVLVDRNSTKYM